MNKLIHITDLYHPHADPDDHFDLAQIYALVKARDIDLLQIVIDYPANDFHGDPALCAAAQLGEIAGADVPVTVGADVDRFRGRPELWRDARPGDVKASERIIRILSESEEKVYITIVGGCLDTAVALARAPEVFREKCAGIVLNAGSGTNTSRLEWNVALGVKEYAAIFRAPCPVFWNPCFDNIETGEGRYKTYWKFRMSRVFDEIGDPLKAYFAYMLTKSEDPKYLRYLRRPADEKLMSELGQLTRNMWCTGSIFSVGGWTVGTDGRLARLGECLYALQGGLHGLPQASADRKSGNRNAGFYACKS